jgi:hypothetical protein
LLRKLIAAVSALTALVMLREPVMAQSTEPADFSLEASIGLDGWVEFSEPVLLRVTVRSELLFSGSLELQQGRGVVTTPVEVPAGGEKTYELSVSATMATRTLTVELVSAGDDRSVAEIRVSPKDPTGKILVGTLGFAGELALPSATSIASVPIVEVRLDANATDLAVLDYLVVAGGAEVSDSVLQWVAEGGRLLVQPDAAAGVLGASAVADLRRPGVYGWGAGQILEQGHPSPTIEEWASLLVPFRDERHLTDFWGSTEVQMIRAASNSAKEGLPYSGVLVGLVIYAIVVAPVNLIVLRRMRRRELAWITVPAISLAAVLTFLVVGAVQNDSTDWGQATIVAGSPNGSKTMSVVAAAANGSLTQALTTSGDYVMYPAATADGFGVGGQAAVRRVLSAQQIDLVFGDAGYGTVVLSGPVPNMPLVKIAESSIHVQNLSPYEFEAFGAVAGATATVAPGRLAAGEEATFDYDDGICPVCSAAEAVAHQTGLWNNTSWWQIYEPLAAAAREQVGDRHFFGFVENLPLTISVNGELRTINGPGIVVQQIDDIDLGHASPRIVATSPDSNMQGEGAWRWLSGEWALMEFTVPVGREIRLTHEADMFGPLPSSFEAWDWATESFVAVEAGEIDQQRFVDPDGTVLIRIDLHEVFGEFPIGSLSLLWDTG